MTMCQQKFGAIFKVNVLCNDSDEVISLYRKRKGLPVILPVGMRIIDGEYDFEITGVSAPISFDIVTYRCDLYGVFTHEQVAELITKYGWRKE